MHFDLAVVLQIYFWLCSNSRGILVSRFFKPAKFSFDKVFQLGQIQNLNSLSISNHITCEHKHHKIKGLCSAKPWYSNL